MRRSLQLKQQLQQTIEAEIAARTQQHQAQIAALKSPAPNRMASHAASAARPLVLLAHGDSWFDYPLDGNALSLHSTDVIAQLQTAGAIPPSILNVSHNGDSSSDEMALPKQQRLIAALRDSNNWIGDQPDAILFSGGGNDIAGDKFCILLDYADSASDGLNLVRFTKLLEMVEASYLDLFAFRDRYAPGVPIFGHCYDFAIPNGSHPLCAGPWLLPSLAYCGWTASDGIPIVRQALEGLAARLRKLAAVPANNFILVETQGTLAVADWANELHPYPAGFRKIAEKFAAALRLQFPGHI